jgi:hypothetical protein
MACLCTPRARAPAATQTKDRGRFSLFAGYPPLREALRLRLWPEAINFGFTAWYGVAGCLSDDQGHMTRRLI